jgi:hypothetical protein
MKMLWLIDPKTKEESVSLTLAIFCTFLLTGAGIAQVLGKINTLGPFVEMFFSSWALYFGRRFSVNGKSYSSDKAEDIKQKVE